MEAPDLPPLGRSSEHARGLRLDAVVDAWQKLERLLLAVEDARLADRLVVPEPRMLLRQVDAAGEGGEPVPEPRVDAALRGVQRREGLPALVGVGELALHQLGEDAAAAVRGKHTDRHDASRRNLGAAWDRGLKEVRTRPSHDRPVVESRVNPLRGEDLPEELDVLLGRATAEVVPDGVECALHILGRADPDLDRH